MIDEEPFAQFVQELRRGDEAAWVELCKRYEERLRVIARRRLKLDMRSRLDGDDPVQSVFRTFFRRLRDTDLDPSDPAHLEHLLISVTLCKAVNSVKFHHRIRRDARREERGTAADGSQDAIFARTAQTREFSPEELAIYTDQLDQLYGSLPEDQRKILELRLNGCTYEEIKDVLKTSMSTVDRKIKRIRTFFLSAANELSDDPDKPRPLRH